MREPNAGDYITLTHEDEVEAFNAVLPRPLDSFEESGESCWYMCFMWADSFGGLHAETPVHYFGNTVSEFEPCRRHMQRYGEAVEPDNTLLLPLEDMDNTFEVDLSRSLVVCPWEWIDDNDGLARVLQELSSNSDNAAVRDSGFISGRVYASVLEENGVDEFPAEHMDVIARVRTDGSLHDAMRAALSLFPPVQLNTLEPRATVSEPYVERLASIRSETLRAHVSSFCLDANSARCFGGEIVDSPEYVHQLADIPGVELVVGMDFGEGQAGRGVYKVSNEARAIIAGAGSPEEVGR